MKKSADLSDEIIDYVALCPLANELRIPPSQIVAFGDTPIEQLRFSERIFTSLTHRGFRTVGEVLELPAVYLHHIPNLGRISIQEIKRKLKAFLNAAAAEKIDGGEDIAPIDIAPMEACEAQALRENFLKEAKSKMALSPLRKYSRTSDDVITDLSDCPSLAQTLHISPEQIENINSVRISRTLFSNRTYNCLMRRHITTIGMLLKISEGELYTIRNLGFRSVEEIKARINELLTNRALGNSGGYTSVDNITTDCSVLSSFPLSQILNILPEQLKTIEDIPICKLHFANRTFHCLMKRGIETVGMLLAMSEEQLYKIRNFGNKSMEDIKSRLHVLLGSSTIEPPSEATSQAMSRYSLGNVLGFSMEDIQNVAVFRIRDLVLSRDALKSLHKRRFYTVFQLLFVEESTLRSEYHLIDGVIDEIKKCLTNLLFETQKMSRAANVQLFWSIPSFVESWIASSESDGSEDDALQERRQLRNEATGREYTLDGILDACQQLCKEREWAIITARCGLNSSEKIKTLHEISKEMGVSRERIRQQETQALNRIKDADGIISAFYETLVWMFERNKGILNIGHAAEELQKYFSPGDVPAANLCLLFCKTFPEFTTVARAAAQNVKDAAPSTEEPIYALKDKADGFASVIETARKLWLERETTIRSDAWQGHVVDVLNKNGCYFDSKYVLACLRADGRFDPNHFDAVQKLPTLKLALVETLQQMGAPAHYTNIYAKLNRLELLDKVTNERSVFSCLGIYPDLFVCIDRGTYGLASWGLADQRITRDRSKLIVDIIEEFLSKRDAPAPQKEIIDYVVQRKKCRDLSVSQRLANDSKFRRTAPGTYGLSKWYFGDATSVELPTIKSTVAEALKRIGAPAHAAEITKRLNEDQLMDSNIPKSSVHVCLNTQRDLFVRVGKGIYGLTSWGLEDQRVTRDRSANIADIAEAFLEKHNEPATVQEIADYVTAQVECKSAAVNGALSRDSRFRRTDRGIYGLERWFF